MNTTTRDRIRKLAAYRASVTHGAWLLDSAGQALCLVQVRFEASSTAGVACEGGYLYENGKSIQHHTIDPERLALLSREGVTLRMAGDELPITDLTMHLREDGSPYSFDLAFQIKPVRAQSARKKQTLATALAGGLLANAA